jgi:hypothetical protein
VSRYVHPFRVETCGKNYTRSSVLVIYILLLLVHVLVFVLGILILTFMKFYMLRHSKPGVNKFREPDRRDD